MAIKFKLVLILMLSGNLLFAESFLKGTLMFKNGDTKRCFVLPPKDYKQKTIIYKIDENSKKEEIASDSLKSISIEGGNGKSIDFDRLPTSLYENKKPGKKCWLLVVQKGSITLYLMSTYKISNKGSVSTMTHYWVGNELPTITYYIKKKNQDVALAFATTSNSPTVFGLNSTLKKSAARYLREYPELVNKIDKNEYTHKDIEEIIMIYNAYMIKKE